MVGRLSYAMLPVVLLFGIERATRSFAVAGVALGVFSVMSLAAPVKSRYVDQYGLRKILVPLAIVYAILFGLLGLAAGQRLTGPVSYVLLAALAGLATPPLGPSTRAVWAILTPDPQARQRAYSLDTIAEEGLWMIGPIIAGALVALAGTSASLIMSGLLLLAGTIGLATSPAAAKIRGSAATGAVRSARFLPFSVRGFTLLVIVVLGIGIGLGPMDVVAVARASAAGSPAAAGIILAALAAGSGLGGLLWGRMEHRQRLSTQLVVLLAFIAATAALAGLAPNLAVMGLCFFVTGTAIAPALIVAYVAVDEIMPDANRAEATTWVNTANNIGVGASVPVAGIIVETMPPGRALEAGAAVIAAFLVVLITFRRSLDTAAIAPVEQSCTQEMKNDAIGS
jgi:MFS family permease